jgi:hypothetical protein
MLVDGGNNTHLSLAPACYTRHMSCHRPNDFVDQEIKVRDFSVAEGRFF